MFNLGWLLLQRVQQPIEDAQPLPALVRSVDRAIVGIPTSAARPVPFPSRRTFFLISPSLAGPGAAKRRGTEVEAGCDGGNDLGERRWTTR
jgi:hypothetical protein